MIKMALDSKKELISSWASKQIMGHNDDLDDLAVEDDIFDDDFLNNLDLNVRKR